ncbi:hypothetical protein AAMO2058_001653100 [Amorphochlora amoebiformis]
MRRAYLASNVRHLAQWRRGFRTFSRRLSMKLNKPRDNVADIIQTTLYSVDALHRFDVEGWEEEGIYFARLSLDITDLSVELENVGVLEGLGHGDSEGSAAEMAAKHLFLQLDHGRALADLRDAIQSRRGCVELGEPELEKALLRQILGIFENAKTTDLGKALPIAVQTLKSFGIQERRSLGIVIGHCVLLATPYECLKAILHIVSAIESGQLSGASPPRSFILWLGRAIVTSVGDVRMGLSVRGSNSESSHANLLTPLFSMNATSLLGDHMLYNRQAGRIFMSASKQLYKRVYAEQFRAPTLFRFRATISDAPKPSFFGLDKEVCLLLDSNAVNIGVEMAATLTNRVIVLTPEMSSEASKTGPNNGQGYILDFLPHLRTIRIVLVGPMLSTADETSRNLAPWLPQIGSRFECSIVGGSLTLSGLTRGITGYLSGCSPLSRLPCHLDYLLFNDKLNPQHNVKPPPERKRSNGRSTTYSNNELSLSPSQEACVLGSRRLRTCGIRALHGAGKKTVMVEIVKKWILDGVDASTDKPEEVSVMRGYGCPVLVLVPRKKVYATYVALMKGGVASARIEHDPHNPERTLDNMVSECRDTYSWSMSSSWFSSTLEVVANLEALCAGIEDILADSFDLDEHLNEEEADMQVDLDPNPNIGVSDASEFEEMTSVIANTGRLGKLVRKATETGIFRRAIIDLDGVDDCDILAALTHLDRYKMERIVFCCGHGVRDDNDSVKQRIIKGLEDMDSMFDLTNQGRMCPKLFEFPLSLVRDYKVRPSDSSIIPNSPAHRRNQGDIPPAFYDRVYRIVPVEADQASATEVSESATELSESATELSESATELSESAGEEDLGCESLRFVNHAEATKVVQVALSLAQTGTLPGDPTGAYGTQGGFGTQENLGGQENHGGYERKRGWRVTVLTPYESQADLINEILQEDTKAENMDRITVRPLDRYHGMETEIVVFSPVRCNSRGELGMLRNDAGSTWPVMDVVLTRASAGFVLVGSVQTLASDPLWKAWISYAMAIDELSTSKALLRAKMARAAAEETASTSDLLASEDIRLRRAAEKLWKSTQDAPNAEAPATARQQLLTIAKNIG